MGAAASVRRRGVGSTEQWGRAGTGDLIQPGFTPVINSVM